MARPSNRFKQELEEKQKKEQKIKEMWLKECLIADDEPSELL